MKQALLVMAKRPASGHTKTRLTPPFSDEQAARLYECFLQDALDIARAVPDVTRYIAYATPDEADKRHPADKRHEADKRHPAVYFKDLAVDFELVPQIGDTLGARLDYVLAYCLKQGAKRVVAMSSDSPTLPAAYVAQAFASLATGKVDVALGPCEDGGYYLIGLTRPQPRILRPVQMSTPHVLHDTLALAKQEGLRATLLPTWYDVDTGDNLARVKTEVASREPEVARHTRHFLGL